MPEGTFDDYLEDIDLGYTPERPTRDDSYAFPTDALITAAEVKYGCVV